ncbi:MAG: hypothetical protein HXX13_01190 [Bacteroidetes bacterium]|nr:hypothetical protein [Bacteroidota bacterium]
MNKSILSPKFYLILSIIFAGAMLRLIPHWPNFTPIASIALFGGTYLKRKELAFLIPVLAMLLSDVIIGFHNVMIPVYASFLLIVSFGFILKSKVSMVNVVTASLMSSLVFYLITNMASWATGMVPYSTGITGLMQAYIAGLPFFLNGILGDLFFNGVFFGAFYMVTKKSRIFA